MLAEGRHVFGRRPKPRAVRAGHYKDLTETGNRARKVSGTQGMYVLNLTLNSGLKFIIRLTGAQAAGRRACYLCMMNCIFVHAEQQEQVTILRFPIVAFQ